MYIWISGGELPSESVEEHVEDHIHGNGMTKSGLNHEEDINNRIETNQRDVHSDSWLDSLTKSIVSKEANASHEQSTEHHCSWENSKVVEEVFRMLKFVFNRENLKLIARF